jgi:hypothetical protein
MRNKFSVVIIGTLVLLAAAAASAQGTGVPAADPSQAFDVAGNVISFTAGSRSGMPLLVIDDTLSGGEVSVALGPAWFLQLSGFSVLAGDWVELVAYPCASCAAENVAASIVNTTNGTSVELRDEDGVPLWHAAYRGSARSAQGVSSTRRGSPSHGGSGQGNRSGGEWGLDMTTVTTVLGTVEDIRDGTQDGDPHLRLAVDDSILTIHLTANALVKIEAAGILLEQGSELEVTYALTKCWDAMVALSITDPATGLSIQLRDPESGFPLTGSGFGNPR